MSNIEHPGYWWLPGEEDLRRPGTLKIEPNGGVRLELIGHLDLRVWKSSTGEGRQYSGEERAVPVLFGRSRNALFTLTDCATVYREEQLGRDQDFALHHLRASGAIEGVFLTSVDDAVFKLGIGEFENLLPWSRLNSLSLTLDTRSRRSTAQVEPPEAVEAQYGDVTFTLAPTAYSFKPTHTRRSSMVSS